MESTNPVLILFGSYGAFAQKSVFLVFSECGIVVVKYDKDEIKAVTAKLVQESKDRGEGKLKQIAASMHAIGVYCDLLARKSIADILAQSSENFLISKESLVRIQLHESHDTENNQDAYTLLVKSTKEKYKFRLQHSASQIRDLKKVCKDYFPGIYK